MDRLDAGECSTSRGGTRRFWFWWEFSNQNQSHAKTPSGEKVRDTKSLKREGDKPLRPPGALPRSEKIHHPLPLPAVFLHQNNLGGYERYQVRRIAGSGTDHQHSIPACQAQEADGRPQVGRGGDEKAFTQGEGSVMVGHGGQVLRNVFVARQDFQGFTDRRGQVGPADPDGGHHGLRFKPVGIGGGLFQFLRGGVLLGSQGEEKDHAENEPRGGKASMHSKMVAHYSVTSNGILLMEFREFDMMPKSYRRLEVSPKVKLPKGNCETITFKEQQWTLRKWQKPSTPRTSKTASTSFGRIKTPSLPRTARPRTGRSPLSSSFRPRTSQVFSIWDTV